MFTNPLIDAINALTAEIKQLREFLDIPVNRVSAIDLSVFRESQGIDPDEYAINFSDIIKRNTD